MGDANDLWNLEKTPVFSEECDGQAVGKHTGWKWGIEDTCHRHQWGKQIWEWQEKEEVGSILAGAEERCGQCFKGWLGERKGSAETRN